MLVYISRVLHVLLPLEADLDFIRTLNDHLLNFVDAVLSRRRDVELEVLSHIQALFSEKGWSSRQFDDLLHEIDHLKTPDSIIDYLKSVIKNLSHEINPAKSHLSRTPFLAMDRGYTPNLRSSPVHTESQINTLSEAIKPYYKTLPDETILQYLPYALLGIDSKLFVFKDNTILLPAKFNHSYASLLNQVLEPALLFHELKIRAESNTSDQSRIKRLFLSSVSQELNSYSTLVNSVFQSQPTSLLTVYKEIHPKIVPLRVLFHLSHKLNEQGDDFLVLVYKLTKLGDVEVSTMATRIFQLISIPYYDMIENWLLKGQLVDDRDGFFISFNPEADNINDIIQFSPARIPLFLTAIDKNIGQRIFQIGKIIIFLSKYCKELEWTSASSAHYTALVRSCQGLSFMAAHQVSQLIHRMYKELVNYLVYVTFYKYELLVHLKNYKRFLLMEASDFIEKIIADGSEIFDEPSISLTSGQLSRILVNSIKTSSVKNIEFRYQSRLDARILELSHGSIGWEVFTLEYKVNDLPIHSIVSANGGTANYLKTFNFLWKLRHFTSILNAGFVESCSLRRNDLRLVSQRYSQLKQQMRNAEFLMNLRDRRTYWIVKSFNTVNVVRHEMMSLLEAITYYLSYDVIEDSFQRQLLQKFFAALEQRPELSERFRSQMAEVQKQKFGGERPGVRQQVAVNEYNLDELVGIHTSFLLSIVNSRLLDSFIVGKISGRSFVAQIYLFLEMMFMYANSWDQYAVHLVNYVGIVSLERGLEQAPESADIMELDDDLERNEEALQILTHKIYTELYLEKFKPQMEALVRDLKGDIELRPLGRSL